MQRVYRAFSWELLGHGTEGEGDLENAVSNCLRSLLFTRTVSQGLLSTDHTKMRADVFLCISDRASFVVCSKESQRMLRVWSVFIFWRTCSLPPPGIPTFPLSGSCQCRYVLSAADRDGLEHITRFWRFCA